MFVHIIKYKTKVKRRKTNLTQKQLGKNQFHRKASEAKNQIQKHYAVC